MDVQKTLKNSEVPGRQMPVFHPPPADAMTAVK